MLSRFYLGCHQPCQAQRLVLKDKWLIKSIKVDHAGKTPRNWGGSLYNLSLRCRSQVNSHTRCWIILCQLPFCNTVQGGEMEIKRKEDIGIKRHEFKHQIF